MSGITTEPKLELQLSNHEKAQHYLITAMALEPQNVAAKALWEKLHDTG